PTTRKLPSACAISSDLKTIRIFCRCNKKAAPAWCERRQLSELAEELFLLFRRLFGFAAFLLGLEPFFLALRAFRGALHQFGSDQFDHGQFGTVALAGSEA